MMRSRRKLVTQLEDKTPWTGMIRISEVVNQIWKAMNERYGVTARPSWKILWLERIRKPNGDTRERIKHREKGLFKVIRISDS